jgi:segregation and condensation protein B
MSEPDVVAEEQIAFDVNDFPGGARSAIEAVLMVVDEPITEVALASALELPTDDVRGHLEELEQEYAAQRRGFTLRSVAGGWRVYSRSDYAPVVEKFLLDGQQAKLTQASLETLAVIAYRQPITAAEITEVRGVNTSGVLNTLLERHLIKIVGRKPVVGRPFMYATTKEFLIRFGLNDLTDLPRVEDMAEALGLDAPILTERTPSEEMLPLDEPEDELDGDPEPGESIH